METVGNQLINSLMRSRIVVVGDKLREQMFEMPFAEHDEFAKALVLNRLDARGCDTWFRMTGFRWKPGL